MYDANEGMNEWDGICERKGEFSTLSSNKTEL